MLEAKEPSVRLHFASISRDRPSREVPAKHSAWRILSVTFLPFTHIIYVLITHKSKGGYSDRKTLDRCKVEFNQPSCWLYSVPNLLVF